jgi:hypothetical protein
MQLLDLADDVLISIIHKITLWDARSLALACPPLAPLIASETKRVVDEATRLPAPPCLDAYARSRPSFQERCQGPFILLRTPRDLTVHSYEAGVSVTLVQRGASTKISVAVIDPACRPTLASLHSVTARLAWLAGAFDVTEYRTRAVQHHPPTEILNVLVTRVVSTHPLFSKGDHACA